MQGNDTERDDPAALTRRLGLVSTTAIIVAEVIGAGIFLTPARMARSLGSPFWLLAVWLAMAVITMSGAVCYGGLAARFPEAGGGYVYLREAFGPRVGFLYGWMSALITDPGLTALFAVGMAGSLKDVAGLSSISVRAIAVVAIASVAVVNIAGVRTGATLLRGLTALKLLLLALIVVRGLGFGRGDWSNLLPLVARRPGSEPLPQALEGGLIAAFFSFGGWWDAGKLAGETRDPRRTIPRALALGVVIVTAVYVLISLAFLYLVPTEKIESDQAFASLAGAALFGAAGGQVFAVVVATVILGSLAAMIMAAPRVYYAMARDGLFPIALAAIHPRFETPARAIVLQAALASLLVVAGTFEQILAYFFFVTIAFLALTVAGVFVLDRRREGERLGPLIPGYPLTPLVFLLPIAMLLVTLALRSPMQSSLGLLVVLLGLPAYQVALRSGALKIAGRPGSIAEPSVDLGI